MGEVKASPTFTCTIMATRTLIYEHDSYIESCRLGETELQQGEEVYLFLKDKNPLWPVKIKAIVALISHTLHGRIYSFEYEELDLNGGLLIENCDVSSIRCYSCCDAIDDRLSRLISSLPVTELPDGTFVLNTPLP